MSPKKADPVTQEIRSHARFELLNEITNVLEALHAAADTEQAQEALEEAIEAVKAIDET